MTDENTTHHRFRLRLGARRRPQPGKARVAVMRARRRAAGLVCVQVWARRSTADLLRPLSRAELAAVGLARLTPDKAALLDDALLELVARLREERA